MISSKIKSFMIATGIFVLSVSVFTGCKNMFGEEALPSGPQNAQNIPQAPLVVDGARTSYADVVEKTAAAVVKVTAERSASSSRSETPQNRLPFPFGEQPQQRGPSRGLGSGVIVSAEGTILTNNHVIEGADKVQIEMNDKRSFEAKVVGTDKLSDLAVLKIEGQTAMPYLNMGDSDRVRIGDVVLAIGNPLGIGQTVTAGIISAKGRRTGLGDGSFEDFLQTDAPINQGNSGGALINVSGELIGINSQILSTGGMGGGGGNIGIGFSIPTNMAKTVMEQLLKDGKVRRGQLGVIVQNVTADLAQVFGIKGLDGVIVSEVKSGSPAEKAGVQQGDVILTLNGEKVEDSNSLRNKIAATAPGTEVTLKIQRKGAEQDIKATLAEASTETRASAEGEPQREEGGSSEAGKLGVEVVVEDGKLVIAAVKPDGPAASAGLRKGDVIVSVNQQQVKTLDEMRKAMEASADRVLLNINRNGGAVFIVVPLK